MFYLLVTIILSLFAAMVFLNVYFRVRVLKSYKVLVQNKVEFGTAHVFSRKKMAEEILPKYPHLQKEITAFADHLRNSIRMATVLIALITAFGAVFMYYKK
ncbi:MAG: hypothetical protein H6555_00970 [Lewinellaceae bacterium]|nr:hypothetical protein [Lewinellaceae bacterium]